MKRNTFAVAALLSLCAVVAIVANSLAQDRHDEALAALAQGDAAFSESRWQDAAVAYSAAARDLPPGDPRDTALTRVFVALAEASDHHAIDTLEGGLLSHTGRITGLEARVNAQRLAALYLASRDHTYHEDRRTGLRDYNLNIEKLPEEEQRHWRWHDTTRADLEAALALILPAQNGSRTLLDTAEGKPAREALQRHVALTLEVCDLLEVNDRLNGRRANQMYFFGSDYGHAPERVEEPEVEIEWDEEDPVEAPQPIVPSTLSPSQEPFTRRGYYMQPDYPSLRVIDALMDNAAHRARELGDRELQAAILYRQAMLLVNVGLYGNASLNARLTDWRNPGTPQLDPTRDPRRVLRKLLADFKGSIWDDEARFMLGYIAYYLNDFAAARAEFALLEKDFPTTRYLGEARRLLQVIEFPQLFTSFSTGDSSNVLVAPGANLSISVHARNIDRVSISLRRLDLRALMANAPGGEHAWGELELLEKLPGFEAALGLSVLDQSFALDPATPHFYQTRAAIGLYTHTPGVYVLEVSGGPVRERKLVQIADLALNRRRLDATEQFWVTTRNGQPVADALVRGAYVENVHVEVPYLETVLIDQNAPERGTREVVRYRNERRMIEHPVRGRTDANGLLEAPLPPENINNIWALVDTGGAMYLVNDRHHGKHIRDPEPWLPQPVQPPVTDLRAFVYSDRPVYRPGDTAHLRVITRLPMAQGTAEGEAVTLRVMYGGVEQHRETVTLNEYGCATGRFDIPFGAPLGAYSVIVENPRIGGVTRFDLNVLEYFKRDVALEIEAPDKPVAPGSDLEIPFIFKFLAGGHVQGGEVSYNIAARSTDGRTFTPAAGTGRTNLDGRLVVTLDTGRISRDAAGRTVNLTITGTATGPGGQTVEAAATATISGSGISVSAEWPTANWYTSSPSMRLTVTNGAGGRVRATGTCTVWLITDHSSVIPGEWRNPSIKQIAAHSFDTSTWTQVALNIPQSSGRYLVTFDGVADGEAVKLTHSLLLIGRGDLADTEMAIVPEFDSYDLTVPARMLVVQPSPGPLLFGLHADGVESGHRSLTSATAATVTTLELTEANAPHTHLTARAVRNGRFHAAQHAVTVRPASRAIRVDVRLDRSQYAPGEEVTADIQTLNHKGEPVAAEVALSVWDSALKEFAASALKASLYDHFLAGTSRFRATDRDIASRTRVGPTRRNEAKVTRWHIAGMPPGSFFWGALSWTSTQGISLASALEDPGHLFDKMRLVADAKNSQGEPPPPPPAPPAADPYYGEFAKGGVGGGGGRGGAGGFAHRRARGGGGRASDQTIQAERRDFRDSAYFNPAIRTGAEGRATIKFTLPDNLTEWTFEATATDRVAAIGQTEGTFKSARPLSVRLVGPRGLTDGDEIELCALVQNLQGSAQHVSLAVDLNAEAASATLTLLNAPAETVAFVEAGRSHEFRFRVRVSGTGTATLRVQAESDTGDDTLVWRYTVAPRGMLVTETTTFVMEMVDNEMDLTAWLPAGAILDRSSVTVQFNGSILGSVVDALPGLVSYPYGCAEQSTNRFVPLMAAIQMLAAYNLDLYEIGRARMGYDGIVAGENWPDELKDPVELQKMVGVGFGVLRGYQNGDGGWGWFRGNGSSPHLSPIVLAGLCAAHEVAGTVGLSLPASEGVINDIFLSGARFLINLPHEDDVLTSRALHAAALAVSRLPQTRERADLQSRLAHRVAQLEGSLAQLSSRRAAVAGLIMAQHYSGRDTARAVKALLAGGELDEQGNTIFNSGAPAKSRWHDTDLEAHALAVQALSLAAPQEPALKGAVQGLLRMKQGSGWGNTRATGQAIHALATYLRANKEETAEARVEILLDGKPSGTFERSKGTLLSGRTRWDFAAETVAEDQTVTLRRTGSASVSGSVTVRAFVPVNDAVEEDSNGLSIRRYYVRRRAVAREVEVRVEDQRGREVRRYTDVRVDYEETILREGDELQVGDQVTVTITVKGRAGDRYLCIEDARPGCLEPIAGRFETEPGRVRAMGRLQVIKEERDTSTNFFATDVDSRGELTFQYDCVVVAGGRFTALPARVFDMYDESRNGHSDSARLEVK